MKAKVWVTIFLFSICNVYGHDFKPYEVCKKYGHSWEHVPFVYAVNWQPDCPEYQVCSMCGIKRERSYTDWRIYNN